MAVNKDVNVSLNAQDNVSPVAKKISKVLGDDLTKNITAVGKAFVVANQAAQLTSAVFNKISGAIGSTIAAANRQEDAINRMNSALKAQGEFSEETSQELQNYASQLQKITKFGDEATLEQIAFAQAMGANVDQSKQIVAAAADMSAALGVDFNSAVRNLSKTIGGLPGELGEVLPELKALSKEQLQAGAGIDLLAAKYEGFARAELNTFSGATAQAKNAWGDLIEQVGQAITQNASIISAVKGSIAVIETLSGQVSVLTGFLSENKDNMIAVGKTVASVTIAVASYVGIQKGRVILEKLLITTTKTSIGVQKVNKLSILASTLATQSQANAAKAQIIVEKASVAIKKLLTTTVIKDTVVQKANMVVQKLSTLALQAQLVAGIALAKIKSVLTVSVIRNTVAEKANLIIQTLASARAKALVLATGLVTGARNLFSLATIKNTALSIANTAATIATNVAQKGLAVGLGITTAAQWALNIALNANPIGLFIAGAAALTAGLFLLFKHIDFVAGALKVGLGTAIVAVSSGITLFAKGVAVVAGLFNKEWANSILKAAEATEKYGKDLLASGRAQIKAAKDAKSNAAASEEVAAKAKMAADKINAQEQALTKLNVQYAKAKGAAAAAFAAAEAFAPRLKLDKFLEEQKDFEKALEDLKAKGESLSISLSAGGGAGIKDQLAQIQKEQSNAEEALKALKIRKAQEIRAVRIEEVGLELELKRQKIFTAEEEIKQLRLSAARENRDQLLEIETQRLLSERGLLSANAQAGISIKKQAALQANNIELEAFRAKLDAERQLSLTMEQQKQLELAELRATLTAGTSAGAEAGEDAEVLKEQQKLEQLRLLRESDLITQQQFFMDRNAIVQAGNQRRFEMEVLQEQERIAALGLSPEALQAKLALQAEKDLMELAQLRFKLESKKLTEEEFAIAANELKQRSSLASISIQEQQLQAEIDLNRRKGESFNATLKEIELAQMKHGKVMGALKGAQGSAEFKAIGGALNSLSSLRNSSSRKQFEIGKKAAIAQATISTFQSATQAFSSLSGIPIIGPALGAAAAAAAVASGLQNIKSIKNQKFGGGGGSAGASGAAPAAPGVSASLGGQADKGMDAVPRSLSGKSFVLSAGERVVQPEANRDLTEFLKEGGGGGSTFNISVNASAGSDIEGIKKAVMEGIREASERGEPVINQRGVV